MAGLQVDRGTKALCPTLTDGQIYYCTDTNEFAIGTAAGVNTYFGQTNGTSFFLGGAHTASTTVPKAIFRLPKAITLSSTVPVLISLLTCNTGAAFIVDIHYIAFVSNATAPAPTTIFTTGPGTNRPSIAAGEYSASSGAADVTSLAAGGFVAIYVDQVGSTIAGSDLMVTLVTA